jgi:hypothetical protein
MKKKTIAALKKKKKKKTIAALKKKKMGQQGPNTSPYWPCLPRQGYCA